MAFSTGFGNSGKLGLVNVSFSQPKPPAPPPPQTTGNPSHDQILKRLHAIETQLIRNMHHTEAVIAAAVEVILAARTPR